MFSTKIRAAAALGALLLALFAGERLALADHATEMKARESFAAGRYEEALSLFAKLYAETLHPVYLRNIGRCHQKMREPQKAIDAFKDYLAKGKKISAAERSEVEGYIKEMEALREEQAKASQTPPPPPVATPAPPPSPPATATTTGGEATAVMPMAQEPPPPPQNVLVGQSGPAEQESAPIYTRWWFWTAIAVVAAGGIAAAVLLSGGTEMPDCTTAGASQCM